MVERQPSVDLWQRTYLVGVATAIYRVQTKRGAVFMSVMRSNYCNEDRAVVIVDSGRFLRAWRAAAGPAWLGGVHALVDPILRKWKPFPGRDRWLPYLPRSAWETDYKFQRAEKGFAHGADPVPLANVYVSGSETAPAVDFTDGITRTLWLLVNGAPAFPVECRRQKAEALSCAAGVDWAQWLTVQDLTGDLSWSDWLHSAHLLTPEKPEGAG